MAPSDLQTPLPLPEFFPIGQLGFISDQYKVIILITNKTPLRNGNYHTTDPITEMGIAHTVGHGQLMLIYDAHLRVP